jgi:hypothetical protein
MDPSQSPYARFCAELGSSTIWAECEGLDGFIFLCLEDELSLIADSVELYEIVEGDESK